MNVKIERISAPRRRAKRWSGSVAFASASALILVAQLVIAPPSSAAQAPVGLGTVAAYSVLGGSTVTNTGPTSLSGDLGVSPGSAITGFPPGITTGATHAGDAAALQAQSDLTTAYNDAAGRAKTASVAGDLVGRTLTSGVYKSTGPLALSGTLTLDGQGNPNAVFIFQIASTLITASASHVSVLNGAQACHVYWQVGSSATLGTTSTFQGTIMALTSVTVTTGTTVVGRALARNGAVTLDNNTFTDPSCQTNPPPIATTTTVTASPNPAATDSTVTLTAGVHASGSAIQTGTVTFTEGGTTLGTAPLDSTGHATLTIPAGPAAGTRVITAHYNGHGTLTPSSSRPTALRVHAAPTSTASATNTGSATASASSTGASSTAPGSTTSTATAVPIAATGAQHIGYLVGVATALLVGGLALIWTAGRRRKYSARH